MVGFRNVLSVCLKALCERLPLDVLPPATIQPLVQEAPAPDDGFKLPVPSRLGELLVKAAYDPFSLSKADCFEIRQIVIAPALVLNDGLLAEKTMEVLDALRLAELAVSVEFTMTVPTCYGDVRSANSFLQKQAIFAKNAYGLLSNIAKRKSCVSDRVTEMADLMETRIKTVINGGSFNAWRDRVEVFQTKSEATRCDLLHGIAQPLLQELLNRVAIAEPLPVQSTPKARSSFAKAGVRYENWNNSSALMLT